VIDLHARVRILVQPDQRAALREFFSEALGLLPASDEDDILVWRFTNGGALCAQFSRDALDHELAARGAWLEVVSDERVQVEQRIRGAGARVFYVGKSEGTHFELPGGQVIRLSSPDEL
jgi:hypothetical protein